MKRFIKTAVFSAAVAATALMPLANAQAGSRHRQAAEPRFEVTTPFDEGDAPQGFASLETMAG